MKLERESNGSGGLGTGIGILLVGIAIGALARPDRWVQSLIERAPEPETSRPDLDVQAGGLEYPMTRRSPDVGPGQVERTVDIPKLAIDLTPEAAAKLQRVVSRSKESGMIVQEEGDLVPAQVTFDGKTVAADVRIKGDFLDHIDTDKWSLRVELSDDKLMGMSRFSIQHPKTRGYLWEWLVMQAARRDGLLAPRSTFVDVVLNGNDLGIYYLEEHFTKELIESQGRREGPIVRFVEDLAWGNEEQYGLQDGTSPATTRRANLLSTAEVGAFGEKRLAQAEGLARQLEEALDQLKVIQRQILYTHAYLGESPAARLQAKLDNGARTIEDVLDVEKAARMHALMALFRCKHGMAWKNRRFYHNPVTGRLEPIVFDTNAGTPIAERDPTAMYTHTVSAFLDVPSYHNRLFQFVAEVAHPDYLRDLLAATGADLERFAAAMAEEGFVDGRADPAAVENQLHDQAVYLRELLRPRDGVNFDCRLSTAEVNEERYAGNDGVITVEAWATTAVPVALRGFRFSNGRFLTAREALDTGARGTSRLEHDRDSVVLPHDGRRVLFRFDTDTRLATLRDLQGLKDAVLKESEEDKSFKLRIVAEYRYVTEEEPREELLWIRRFGADWTKEGGRPEIPGLAEALKKHEFLEHDPESGTLEVRPGVWEVSGDLVAPDGLPLAAGPGVTLRFEEGRGIVSGEALLFQGTEEAPVVLEPKAGAPHWGGVCVLQAPAKSIWRHVHVRDTDVFLRSGWMMTGGVTFYGSPVELVDTDFVNSHGEDALNVFGTEFLLERVLIDGVASDAYDGDFVTGLVKDCTIMNSVEDGVDVSGSDIDVVGCRFVAIGDKAISAGEDSVVRARDCVVESSVIGAASKDFSRLELQDVEIRQAKHYGLAVYVKKPEFGSSSIVGKGVVIGETGMGRHIVQEGCELILDDMAFPGVPLDVKELYRQKILGQ